MVGPSARVASGAFSSGTYRAVIPSRLAARAMDSIPAQGRSWECDLSGGLPAFTVVGLPDAAVNEARERVRSAIKNCGFTFPVSRITVNLAPAHLKKVGTLYDLPILVGILAAGRLFSALTALKILAIRQDACGFLPCRAKNPLANPYTSRF